MKENPMIFTKWIWIIPIFIFFITMLVGILFYNPDVPNTNPPFSRECNQLPTASTKVC